MGNSKHINQKKQKGLNSKRIIIIKMEIKLTNFGIAYAYDNTIELNKALLSYPNYLNQVLKHELEHIKHPNTKMDFMVDFKNTFNFHNLKEQLKFTFSHPKLVLQSLAPVWYHKGELNTNSFLIVIYSMSLIVGVLIGTLFLI